MAAGRVPLSRLAVLRSSLVRNSGLLMASTAANLLLGYVFWVIAARSTSVEAIGLASALIAAMSLAVVVGAVGVGNAMIQELPGRQPGRDWSRTLNAGFIFAIALSLAVGVVTIAVLALAGGDGFDVVRRPLVAGGILLGIVILVIGEVIDRSFVAERSSGRMLIRNSAVALVKIPLITTPVLAASATGITSAWILGALITMPLSVLLVLRLGRGWRPVFGDVGVEVRRLRRAVAAHHLVSIGNIAPQFVIQLLVAAVLSTHDNGIFFTTWRVAGGLFTVSVAISTSLFAEGSHSGGDLWRNARRAAMLIVGILLVSGAVLVVGGHQILGILGPEYKEGYALLLIFVVAAFPDAVTNVYVAVLRVERRLRLATLLTVGMSIITLGGTVPLALLFGVEGVGVAWLLAQLAGCVLVAVDMRRRRRSAPA